MWYRRYYVRKGPNGSRDVYAVGFLGAALLDSGPFLKVYFWKLPLFVLSVMWPLVFFNVRPLSGGIALFVFFGSIWYFLLGRYWLQRYRRFTAQDNNTDLEHSPKPHRGSSRSQRAFAEADRRRQARAHRSQRTSTGQPRT